jgi:hypothetical protein
MIYVSSATDSGPRDKIHKWIGAIFEPGAKIHDSRDTIFEPRDLIRELEADVHER